MSKFIRRAIAVLTLVMLLTTMVYFPAPANAANAFYGGYTDVAKIYDYGSCPSMQGLAVGSQKMYTVKIGSNDTRAFISMTDKDSGSTTKLYNADAGSYYFDYLGHANDMDVWGIDGYSNLFVTTTNTGSNAIVRLKRSGNNLTKVASYSLTYNGAATCATALAVKSVSGGKITFITKLGMNLYTGSVSTSATSANIELTKLCTISKSRVYIKGSYLDLSNFVNQGFGYYNNTLFVPITGDDSQLNRSVIMVYDLTNASGTVYPTEALVFRVTSSYYSALFEIESCDICSGDGKLYFNTNRRITNSNTNHDGVSTIDDYTFETIPLDAPTSAPKFTLRYHANGGSGTMADTVVTYGIGTALRANSFTRPGYTFKGWTAYRTAQNQWRYVNGSAGGWYTEGSEPSGYTKYLYKDKTLVSATTAVANDVVHLYAQWEKTSHTITFRDGDGTVLKTGSVGYGVVPTAPADPVKASDGQYSYTFAGWSPAITAVTGDATYTATYTATALDTSTATGTVAPYLDRVDSAGELKEGVPYVISDYKDTWLNYALTTQVVTKVSGSKTHTGYLLDGTPSVNTKDLWYIKGGKLVYGSADSNQYLLINYDASSQGLVQLGSYNASTAAYVSHYRGDDFAIRGGSYYLNRHGGTASDVVATAYTSAGGSYWHLDRVVGEQRVTLGVDASTETLPAGNVTALTPNVKVEGIAVSSCTLNWSSSDSTIAAVSGSGSVTALKAGTVKITATLTAVNGHQLVNPIHVTIPLTVTANTGSVSAVQAGQLIGVNALQTGIPYVLTERVSGAALTGDMVYANDSDYKGLNGTQGLKTVDTIDLSNAPVWYYDGTHLLYGTPTGTDNYLVFNSSNQVALGTISETNIFDRITVYSSSDKTFNLSPSGKTSGSTNYYLNQLGGSKYNAAGLYSSAYYSRWQFSQLLPQRSLTLSVAPGNLTLTAGDTASLTATVAANGSAAGQYSLSWSSSDTSVATASSSGVITSLKAGEAVITATLTGVDGRALDNPLSMKINVKVEADPGYTATAVQESKLVKVTSLQAGVPYVITESYTGAALTGSMVYKTDADYKGLNGTQGLKLVNGIDLNNAPVWYYDGTYLRYGSASGSSNYLIYNASNQVALGSATAGKAFNTIKLYNSSQGTFTVHASAMSSGSTNYYLNQLGGGNYNAAGIYSYAPTSLWHFSKLVARKDVSLNVTPSLSRLNAGKSANLATTVTVDGEAVSDYTLTWSTSNASVATVTNGTVTALAAGQVTITVTLNGAQGDAFENPVTIKIPLTIA